jgi:response regulator RpfG family c-di-GMP phosphodiesterase
MKKMALFTPEELEQDILHDLKEEIFELYEASLQNLVELELVPGDNEMQRALFRSVHTIKGDLGLVGFTPMIEVLQYLEDILDMLRKSEINYSNALHDLVVRLLDKVTSFVEECVVNGKAQYDKDAIDATSAIIKRFDVDKPQDHESLLRQAIAVNSGPDTETVNVESKKAIEIAKTGIPKNISPDKQTDLLFFRELMRPIEKRAGLPEGRGDKIAAIALYINSLSDQAIEEDQLAVACYTHDFGLAFMPEEVVKNKDKPSKMEQNLLRSHVYKSTRLLEHLPAWDGARKIIMHHHEMKDGSGFPLGITGDNICEGAKLLAIVDAYINLTLATKDCTPKMTEIEAIIAINKEYKHVFSAKWLRLFNQGMSDYLNQ